MRDERELHILEERGSAPKRVAVTDSLRGSPFQRSVKLIRHDDESLMQSRRREVVKAGAKSWKQRLGLLVSRDGGSVKVERQLSLLIGPSRYDRIALARGARSPQPLEILNQRIMYFVDAVDPRRRTRNTAPPARIQRVGKIR
jgi:hypothetical protein